MLVVKKPGKNLGRKFYSCHHFPTECDMFKWATNEGQAQTFEREPDNDNEVVSTPQQAPAKKVKITINDKVDVYVSEDALRRLLFE